MKLWTQEDRAFLCLFCLFVLVTSRQCCAVLCCFSCVWLFETQWTVACQAALSMGFCRQEYWSGFPCPPPGIFPTQGSNPCVMYWWAGSLPLVPLRKPQGCSSCSINMWSAYCSWAIALMKWEEGEILGSGGVMDGVLLTQETWTTSPGPLGPGEPRL